MEKFTLNLSGKFPRDNLSKEMLKQSFDYVSRHRTLATILSNYFGEKIPKILDVGGLGSPMQDLLGYKITILDKDTDGKSVTKGNGSELPYSNESFDAVITSDTLEHIPQKDRKNFVAELARVSKDLIIVCAPFLSADNQKAEKRVLDTYKTLVGEEHRWLKEHKNYVLPDVKSVKKYLKSYRSILDIVEFSHTSLHIWEQLMTINLISNEMGYPDVGTVTEEINNLYNTRMYQYDFSKNGYRTFIVASKSRKLQISYRKPKSLEQDTYKLSELETKFYSRCLMNAEYVPVLRRRIKSLHDETINLASLVQEEKNRLEEVKQIANKSRKANRLLKESGY